LTLFVKVLKWNLDETTVRAPALRDQSRTARGARVANLPLSPVMAITDTSDTRIAVETGQIDAHYVEPGHDVEITTPAVGCDPELRQSVLRDRRCDLRATRARQTQRTTGARSQKGLR